MPARQRISSARLTVRPPRAFAVIGVDVLSEQNDLFRAGSDELAGLGLELRDGPREFASARIRHDAKAAELIAALLHSQKSRW